MLTANVQKGCRGDQKLKRPTDQSSGQHIFEDSFPKVVLFKVIPDLHHSLLQILASSPKHQWCLRHSSTVAIIGKAW